jgi:hypothetical protein
MIIRSTDPEFRMARLIVRDVDTLRQMVAESGRIRIHSPCGDHVLVLTDPEEVPTKTLPCPCEHEGCIFIQVDG